jgi:hypothetical protein
MGGHNSLSPILSSFLCASFLIFLGAFPLPSSIATPPQEQGQCRPGTWKALVGSIELVDSYRRNIEIRFRGGAEAVPYKWLEDSWGKTKSSMSADFPAHELTLQALTGEAQQAKLQLTDATELLRATPQGLEPLTAEQLDAGTSVLVVLAAGQCWPRSGIQTLPLASRASVSRLVVLLACVEDSCIKAKCKGKRDCKEKVCNCEHSP